jgi:acyl-CoA thioesterase FadM
MARMKLELPDRFIFSTEIEVRISDINYGGHLGNDSLLSLIHEARVRFLNEYGFSEFDIGGASIIMSDTAIIYKSESFHGDILTFEVAVADVGRIGCDFYYRIYNKKAGKEVAHAKTGIVFFDYEKRKVVNVPGKFRELFG